MDDHLRVFPVCSEISSWVYSVTKIFVLVYSLFRFALHFLIIHQMKLEIKERKLRISNLVTAMMPNIDKIVYFYSNNLSFSYQNR